MKDATHITIVLDRSGSMGAIWDDTVGSFEEFLRKQKEDPKPATLSVAVFDDVFTNVLVCEDLHKAEIDLENYRPRNTTALLDAVGRAITETGEKLAALPEDERPDKVLVVVITDGQENASREFTRAKISEMIRHQSEVYKWDFVYLGANVDAFAEARGLGIPVAHAAHYVHDAAGVKGMSDAVGAMCLSYRSGGSAELDTDEDGYVHGATSDSDTTSKGATP